MWACGNTLGGGGKSSDKTFPGCEKKKSSDITFPFLFGIIERLFFVWITWWGNDL